MIQFQLTLFKILKIVAQCLGVLSSAMIILSVLATLRSLKQAKPVVPRKLFISLLLSCSAVGVYIYFSRIHVSTEQIIGFGLMGALVGMVWASTVRVFRQADRVVSLNSLWYLLVWGFTLALAQIFTFLSQKYVNAAVISSLVTSGIVLGMNGLLYYQFRQLSK